MNQGSEQPLAFYHAPRLLAAWSGLVARDNATLNQLRCRRDHPETIVIIDHMNLSIVQRTAGQNDAHNRFSTECDINEHPLGQRWTGAIAALTVGRLHLHHDADCSFGS